MLRAGFPNSLSDSENLIEGIASPNGKVELEIFFENGDDGHFPREKFQATTGTEGHFHLTFRIPKLDIKPGIKPPDTIYMILTDTTCVVGGSTQSTDYTWAQ